MLAMVFLSLLLPLLLTYTSLKTVALPFPWFSQPSFWIRRLLVCFPSFLPKLYYEPLMQLQSHYLRWNHFQCKQLIHRTFLRPCSNLNRSHFSSIALLTLHRLSFDINLVLLRMNRRKHHFYRELLLRILLDRKWRLNRYFGFLFSQQILLRFEHEQL